MIPATSRVGPCLRARRTRRIDVVGEGGLKEPGHPGRWGVEGEASAHGAWLAAGPTRCQRSGRGPPPGRGWDASRRSRRTRMGAVKLKLDLHDVYNRGDEIDRALRCGCSTRPIAKKASGGRDHPGEGLGPAEKAGAPLSWTARTSRSCTTGWRRIRRTSAGCSCTSAGSSPLSVAHREGSRWRRYAAAACRRSMLVVFQT